MAEAKTLNQKIEELDKNIDWFYSDEFNLDKATDQYQKTIKLAKELQKDLDDLQNKIEILAEDFTK